MKHFIIEYRRLTDNGEFIMENARKQERLLKKKTFIRCRSAASTKIWTTNTKTGSPNACTQVEKYYALR